MKVNELAKKNFKEYREAVEKMRVESKGVLYGVGLKIPQSP